MAEETPRPIPEIIPETPAWLCDIIAKLHAKNPDDRYQSAREIADVLADCEAQLKAHAKIKDFSRIPRGKPRRSGRWKWVAAAAALLLPVIALAVTEFAGVTHLFRGRQISDDPIRFESGPKIGPAKSPAGAMPRDAVLVMNFEKDTFFEKDGKTWVRDLSGRGNDGVCEGVSFTPDGKAGGGLACQGGAPPHPPFAHPRASELHHHRLVSVGRDRVGRGCACPVPVVRRRWHEPLFLLGVGKGRISTSMRGTRTTPQRTGLTYARRRGRSPRVGTFSRRP